VGSVSVSPAWPPTEQHGVCRRQIGAALSQLLTLLVGTLLIAGCATQPGSSLLVELSKADLSEKHPQKVKQAGGPKEARGVETYPGDDQFREKPTTTGASAKKAQGGGAERAGDGYKLNFDNASLAEVSKVILGDTLKITYYYDPRVQGQVTLATGRPVSREELLSVLESALKINNAVLVRTDGGYRISPAADAVAGEMGTVSSDKAEGAGFGVSVLPLRHVSSEAVMKLIENFVSTSGSLKAETTGNLLMVRGTARERQSLVEVAASFDVDWLRGQSAGIFPLTHSTPDEMIADLTQAMSTDQGNLLGKMVRFQPLHRLNAVLVLARQTAHLKQAATWIKRLDRSNEAGQDLHVYRVENGRSQDLAALLNETLGTGAGNGSGRRPVSEVVPGRDVVTIGRGAQTGSGLPITLGGKKGHAILPPKRQAEPPPFAGAPPPGEKQPPGATAIRITADEVNNLLLIHASPSDYRRIATVLRQIDRPPLQVMINATIVEVTLNDTLRYGVQVFLKGKHVSGGAATIPATELPLFPNTAGLNLIVGALTDPKVVLDALSEVTEVKVVSSPSVVVVDNQPALLKVGDEVPVSTQQATILENPDAPLVSTIQFRDTGVILKVIPRINSSGLVTMDIQQEISAVVSQPGGPTLTPTISQRQVASTVSVYSGQMVALGGLISEQKNRDKSGPFAQVPILGDLIGSNSTGTKRTELIVFIRPQVIRDSRDARAVAEELRSRLKSFAQSAEQDHPWRTEAR
jgi:general secretion pathway protein D